LVLFEFLNSFYDIVEGVVRVMQKAPERDFGFKPATLFVKCFLQWAIKNT